MPVRRSAGEDGHDAAGTLAKGLELLRAFRTGDHDLCNKDFVERTGMTKPTVSRLTGALVGLGYLRYSASQRRYSLGISLLSIANPVLADFGFRHLARPYMKALADETGGQVSLGMRDRDTIVYIETSRSPRHHLTTPEIGAVVPILASAIGRAYLASLRSGMREEAMREVARRDPQGWMRYSERAVNARAELDELGFTRSFGEIRREIRSCAVPLRITVDDEPLVMNCGVPTARLAPRQLENEIGPKLMATARAIEAACGPRMLPAAARMAH